MPAMAIEDIRRKLVTDTRPTVLARLREKAVQAGDDPDAVMAKFVTSDQTVADGSREVVGAISAETPDEDDDVILLKGWDLSYFRKHPVVMGFHDYFTYPTGKCLWAKQDKASGRLLAKTKYADRPKSWPREQEWPPDTILELRQQDVMRGYSVGFVMLEDREPTAREVKDHPEWEGKRIIARAKLLEYSDVPLPCNADAAQIMVAKGLLPKQEADDGTDTESAADGAADAGELDDQRGVPTDPDGTTARDADDSDPDADGVVDATSDAQQVLGAAALADPDGVETKPSAENHACEINDGEYTRYRSEKRDSDGKPYTVRFGIKADGTAEEATYFYPVTDWTASQARSHCKSHDGTFAAATGAEAVACEACDAPPAGPTPAEVAHLQVLRDIAAGKFVKLDREKIAQDALENAVKERLKYHKGHLG